MQKEVKKSVLVFWFFLFGILFGGVVLAYPTLDENIEKTLQEDSFYSYNFTQNVTYNPATETLVFSIHEINSTNPLHSGFGVVDYSWISINSSSGNITINATNSNSTDGQTGNFTISIEVVNQVPAGTIIPTYFNVTSVNDAPVFVGLENQTIIIDELFGYNVNVTDEENNIPFNFSINFTSCSVAQWSTRNCSNSSGLQLFNSSNYSFDTTTGVLNISFMPVKNDVGYYILNFSVTDNSTVAPENQTTSQLIGFNVTNINSAPYFNYYCDNERNATEDSEFTCWINATDVDETNNLTFSANYSWFTFNNTGLSSVTVASNITTGYNASAMINFTANDTMVGNWSVNVTITDTGWEGVLVKSNSTVFWFFIDNIEDSVSLDEIVNQTSTESSSVYENRTIYVNATDNDLFVPDKDVKNEVLTFASNLSWVHISSHASSENYTTAKIEIDWNAAYLLGAGNYTARINVTDTAGNSAERNFTIEILGDTAAVWNQTNYVYEIYENNNTFINLSTFISDAENDNINFSFVNTTVFSSFNVTTFNATGIINFTAVDGDVGYHNITINASDGKLNSLVGFNFTIYNVNDAPSIQTPIQINSPNASVELNSNITTSEDNLTTITLSIIDYDIKIPVSQIQEGFYNETLNINLTLQGPNSTLFNFSLQTRNLANGISIYEASFTPSKSDVGSYNITINVTDNGAATIGGVNSDSLLFNLTISQTQHNPVLTNLTNQTSAVNRTLYYDMSATDTEDGADTEGNLTFNVTFLQGTNFINGNETIFNTTSGILNITFNDTQTGSYRLNISVNDSVNTIDSDDFWINVYGLPNVTLPLSSYNFIGLQENISISLNFSVNHSVGNNLTYLFYIDNLVYNGSDFNYGSLTLRKNQSYYGNNTNLTWQFTPNFTDESYGKFKNLTLIVYPATTELENASNLNTTMNWNLNISYANFPVNFLGYIGDKQATYSEDIEINLSEYFLDVDYSDVYYNQTINFSVTSNSTYITSSISSDWILTLSSYQDSVATTELITINASDLDDNNLSLTSVLSNEFKVEFTTPSTTTITTSSSGGGSTRPVSLKIILPGPLSAYKKEQIRVPITLSNTGRVTLSGINLTAIVVRDGLVRKDILASFDKSYFSSLNYGKKESVIMTVNVNTEELGLYEITVNASVKRPEYSDWGKFYLTIKEANKTEVLERILFTEEFLAENPECIEIKELIKESKKYSDAGEYNKAFEKTREAIDACKYAISQQATPVVRENVEERFYRYLTVLSLASFIIGIAYYSYKKIRLKRLALR